jgi:hypothetical protein
MAEYPTTKPVLADPLRWATEAGHEDATEPTSGLKDAGYTVNAKPTNAHYNFHRQRIGEGLAWLEGNAVRNFSTLGEGVHETAPGELFQVYAPAALGATVVTVTPAFHPVCWTVDGKHVYACKTTHEQAPRAPSLFAYSAADGALAWESAAFTVDDNPTAVCSDGAYVFVATVTGTGPYTTTIEQFEAATGTLIDQLVIAGDWLQRSDGLAANGTHLVSIGSNESGSASSGMKVILVDGQSGMSEVATCRYGAHDELVQGVAIGDTWAVMVGAPTTFGEGSDSAILVTVSLADGASLYRYSATAWTWISSTGLLSCATDGERIYATGYPGDPLGATNYATQFLFACGIYEAPA